MNIQLKKESDKPIDRITYPIGTMIICLALICLSPFISMILNYLALIICLYRVIRYDESIFAMDYCILSGVSYIFLTAGGVSMLAWLSIAAAFWYIVRSGIQRNISFILLLLLMDYMLLRMQTAFNMFVLCFSQILLLYVLFSTQKKEWIIQSAQAFCGSIIFSSIFALIFRSTPQLRSILGDEYPAYWGSSVTRFQGLFRDPNYYITLLIISIVLLTMLWMNDYISRKAFLVSSFCLTIFGALTYSKTFLVVLVIFVVIFVAMLFYRKHYFLAIGSIILILASMSILSDSLFSITVYRITSANNLGDLTTGRSELFIEYFDDITKTAGGLFFGKGLSADILSKGTHNLFLEIIYYFGLVGFILMVMYFISFIKLITLKFKNGRKNPNGIFRYTALLVFMALFCTLQGMFFVITYVMLYLAILATAITPRDDVSENSLVGG